MSNIPARPKTRNVYRDKARCFMRLRNLYLHLAEKYGRDVAVSALIDLANVSSLK
jgi:hypothetical protein